MRIGVGIGRTGINNHQRAACAQAVIAALGQGAQRASPAVGPGQNGIDG